LLISKIRQRKVIPFLGAGVSIKHLGGWWEVLWDLWDHNELGPKAAFSRLRKKGDAIVAAELMRQKLGTNLSIKVKEVLASRLEKTPLPEHYIVANGPWPAILTTNWDSFMERALADTLPGHAMGAPSQAASLRADASAVYASIRAGAIHRHVMKLHGDFSERGIGEFVLGHRDYRRVMAREPDVLTLLEHLAADYSFMFYGTSLTDPDLRACLDVVHEHLGAAVGPHFWFTRFKECDDAYAQFLLKNYAIHALRYKDFDDVREAVRGVLDAVSRPSAELSSAAYHFTDWGLHLTLTSARIDGAHSGPAVARAISVAALEDGQLDLSAPSSMLKGLIADVGPIQDIHMREGTAKKVDVGGQTWWLVCGQQAGGFGRTSLVRLATLDLLRKATKLGAKEIHMPLLAKGGGQLPPHEVLLAQLHAIGEFASHTHTGAHLHVVLHSVDRWPKKGDVLGAEQPYNPLVDVVEGRVLPAESVAHGAANVMQFTVVHPDAHNLQETRSMHHARVCLATNALVLDLLVALGLPARNVFVLRAGGTHVARTAAPSDRLLDHDLTEGSFAHLRFTKSPAASRG